MGRPSRARVTGKTVYTLSPYSTAALVMLRVASPVAMSWSPK